MRRVRFLWILATVVAAGGDALAGGPWEPTLDDVPTAPSRPNGGSAPTRPAVFGTTRTGNAAEPQADKSHVENRGGVRVSGAPARLSSGPTRSRNPQAGAARRDAPVRSVQASASDLNTSNTLNLSPLPAPGTVTSVPATPVAGGQSISLQAALHGALTSNPDLVTLRQGNALAVSAEAVEVARHFPTALNPTVWIDYRPINLIPNGTFGRGAPGGHAGLPGANNFYHYGQNYIYVSLRQPVELGHQTTHRYRIAKAAYDQQKWIVIQAELTALVQTYRFFQTAAYRRDKYRLAEQLAEFSGHLVETLNRRLEANPALAADGSLARVEARATRQQVMAARQDYLTALADLRNQVGIPEQAAAIEPVGDLALRSFIPPLDENVLITEALENRPDVRAANAQVASTRSAVDLARGPDSNSRDRPCVCAG